MKDKKNKQTKENVDKKNIITRVILLILILIWVFLVYGFSNQSGTESSGISRKVAELLFDSEDVINKAEPIIRKLAHFSEYSIGGILFYSLFSTYDFTKRKRSLISLGLGIWYAIFDEIHQLFVPGRSGNVVDVIIDSSGVLFGIIFIRVIFKIVEIIKNKRKTKEGAKS